MKSSYSQNNTYIKCPKNWSLRYQEKLEPLEHGASTFFGLAIDEAVQTLLLNKGDFIESFKKKWYATTEKDKTYPIFDNPDLIYAYSDFDKHVFDEIDKSTLIKWLVELGLFGGRLGTTGIEAYQEAAKIKKNPYKQLSQKELQYFNRVSWLSLHNKGIILLKGFETEFYPKITKVHAVQQFGNLKDEDSGDSLVGVIDLVVDLQGYDKPIIFDLKTASRPYEDEKIDTTEQLSIYAAMKGGEYKTNLVGYVVLVKQLEKETLQRCPSCGKIKNNRAMKCDGIVDGSRCNTEWEEKTLVKPKVQILIREKTDQQINEVLQDQSNIVKAMRNGIIFRNTEACSMWYGGLCPYINYCHKDKDMTGLKKRGE